MSHLLTVDGVGLTRDPRAGDGAMHRQVLSLGAGRAAGALAVGALYVVAARHLPVGQYATFALLQALASMFLVGADLGTSTMLADVVSDDHRRALAAFRRVVAMRARMVIPVWVAIAGGLVVAAPGSAASVAVTAVLFLPVVVGSVISTTAESVLRALGMAWVEGAETVVFRSLQLGATWAWLVAGGGLDAAIVVNAVMSLAAALAVTAVAVWASPSDRLPVPPGALTFGRGRWLTAATVIGTVYDRIDTWLLALLATPLAVSVYASDYRIFGAVLLLANAVAALAVPFTAGQRGGDLVRTGRKLIAWALACTAPLVVLVAVLAPSLLRTLFGPGFVGGADALRILMVAALPSVVGAALIPRAMLLDGRRITVVFVASLVANVLIDVACIHWLGAVGAAIGTAGCQAAMSLFVWRRYVRAAQSQEVTA